MENTEVTLNRMCPQRPGEGTGNPARWRWPPPSPAPPLLFTNKTDVLGGWGPPGATPRRPTPPTPLATFWPRPGEACLEEGASSFGYREGNRVQQASPETKDPKSPGHGSTQMRQHPAPQHSAEPGGPPLTRPQAPEPQSGCSQVRLQQGRTAHSRAVARAKSPFPNPAHSRGRTSGSGHGTLLSRAFPVRESASPRKPFPLLSMF